MEEHLFSFYTSLSLSLSLYTKRLIILQNQIYTTSKESAMRNILQK